MLKCKFTLIMIHYDIPRVFVSFLSKAEFYEVIIRNAILFRVVVGTFLFFPLLDASIWRNALHQFVHVYGNLVIGDNGIDLGASQIGMSHHLGDAFH